MGDLIPHWGRGGGDSESRPLKCKFVSITGVLICVAAQLYPTRMVSSIYLLRGGRMVSWTTYGLLGRLRVKKYQLKHISCESDPASKDRYMQFKLKGKYLHFLVDKKKGKFYNDKIFKGSVGLRRVWE